MERIIKFRGKSISGDWVYGDLIQLDTQLCIAGSHQWAGMPANNSIEIDVTKIVPETVGLFSGLKAGKHKMNLDPDVYEGDLFRGLDADDNDIFYVVMWIDQRGAFYMVPIDHYTVIRDNDVSREKEFDWLFQDALLYDFSIDVGLMKVGNIHDNPELINKL